MVSTVSAENTIRSEDPQASHAAERRRTHVVAVTAFIAALIIRGITAWYAGGAQPQEVRYITIARGIESGKGYHGLDNRFPDIVQPPLYPLILSVALLLPGPDLAVARGVSILMGAVLIFPCVVIARRLFGEKAARRAACLVAVYPLLADISAAAITESTFALLVTLAALAIWRALDRGGAAGWARYSTLAGLVLGLAFLTRPEGLTYLMAAWLVCLIDAVGKKGPVSAALRHLRPIALSAAGFVLVVSPYLIWVHAQTHHWLLAPKAILYQVHETLRLEGQRENWKEPFDSLLFSEHVKFGLNKEATAIRAHADFSAASASVAEGLLVSDEDEVRALGAMMAVRLVLHNFSELYLETIKYGFVIPSLLVMLAGIGLVSRPWVGEFRRATLIVMIFLLGSFTFLVSHVEPRFLYTAMPFLLPWIAEGWRRSEVWLLATISGGGAHLAASRERYVRVLVGVMVLTLTLLHLPPAVRITSNLWPEHRELGLWLRNTARRDTKVMAATAVVAYYAETQFEVLPYADQQSMLAYARSKGVEYLVADRAEIPTVRPQLTPLLIPERPHPGLELVKALHEGTSHAIFLYRVSPLSEAFR